MLLHRATSFFLLCAAPALAFSQLRPVDSSSAERETRHASPDWLLVQPHLPSPTTGTAAQLQLAGDVLRARRMTEDALDYYRYALARGGDEGALLNRIGITELELHQPALARAMLRRATQVKPRNPDSWNNLGAAEYADADFHAAVTDYKRAIKLNKKDATFHANLGTAYFDMKDFESAQKQFAQAFALDHTVFDRNGFGGVEAHILSPADRGRFCFEMARLAAAHHDEETMLHWLAQASEAGYDVAPEMANDHHLYAYRKDPRVELILTNARALRGRNLAASAPVPTLPPETPRQN
jgi:tetratricopeptide (TPR) repeat protein